MIISRESDYAIRILRVLADGQQHSMRDICSSECIPLQFGYKILEKLRNAEYVVCIRGKNGGCKLGCELKDASVYDLLAVIDNNCYVNACFSPDHECEWKKTHPEGCRVHEKLGAVQASLDETFKNISLYSLILE